jgi:lysophospholipase L1-like esterase
VRWHLGRPSALFAPQDALLLIFILLLLSCAADAAKTTVVCLGDSITLGEGVRKEENFVSLLGAANPRWETVNHGRSGWSTSTYLERKQQFVSAIPENARTILVLLGTNDILYGYTDNSVARVARQMDELTDLIHQRAPTAEIVLLTPINVFPADLSVRLRRAGFGEKSPEYLKRIGDALRDLANRKGYRCVDLYLVVTAGNTLDGVHPNAAGHRQIKDAILKALGDR